MCTFCTLIWYLLHLSKTLSLAVTDYPNFGLKTDGVQKNQKPSSWAFSCQKGRVIHPLAPMQSQPYHCWKEPLWIGPVQHVIPQTRQRLPVINQTCFCCLLEISESKEAIEYLSGHSSQLVGCVWFGRLLKQKNQATFQWKGEDGLYSYFVLVMEWSVLSKYGHINTTLWVSWKENYIGCYPRWPYCCEA